MDVSIRDLFVMAFHCAFGVTRITEPRIFNTCPMEYKIAKVAMSSEATKDTVDKRERTHPIPLQMSQPMIRYLRERSGQQLLSSVVKDDSFITSEILSMVIILSVSVAVPPLLFFDYLFPINLYIMKKIVLLSKRSNGLLESQRSIKDIKPL
jgi:hypothetical protein